jgi:hypothetical protein
MKYPLFPRLYGVGGAGVRTSTAIGAQFRIDGILVITLTDSFNRTFIDASTAGDAFISNYVSHCSTSPFLVSCLVGIGIIMKWQVFFLVFYASVYYIFQT